MITNIVHKKSKSIKKKRDISSLERFLANIIQFIDKNISYLEGKGDETLMYGGGMSDEEYYDSDIE